MTGLLRLRCPPWPPLPLVGLLGLLAPVTGAWVGDAEGPAATSPSPTTLPPSPLDLDEGTCGGPCGLRVGLARAVVAGG